MSKNLHTWIGSYIRQVLSRPFKRANTVKPTHIMFCCVDHFEPDWNKADTHVQINRVKRWVAEYPELAQKTP